MHTNRRAFKLLALPFGAVTIATLMLYFFADQALDALQIAMRVSDVWMEADRSGALQVDRCLDAGGVECDLLQERLKRPLAYIRAARERAKPNPDLRVMREDLVEAGVENVSLWRFRLHWYERVSQFVGLNGRNANQKTQPATQGRGGAPSDIEKLIILNNRARAARTKVPVDALEIDSIQRDLNEFRSGIELNKREFDVKSQAASNRLRQMLYLVVASCVVGMFAIAAWISQGMLKRWDAKEREFRARDKELSSELQVRVEELQKAVGEKAVLLRELQHRVKNNLQVVSSLSSLQARNMEHGEAKNALISIQDRVKSLALIHESLCFSSSVAEVDFAKYIQLFAPHLIASYQPKSAAICLHIEANAVVGLEEATPCALILNELMSNALKHAFPDSKEGNIWIQFSELEQEFVLEVRDDGVGMPADYLIEKADSLGLQLVEDLALQLRGSFMRANEGGAAFRVKFRRRQPKGMAQEDSNEMELSASNRQA